MQEKVIFVFPGQGAQYVGMGKDLFHEFAVARYTFQQVSDIAHRDIAGICFNGPESELNMPENTSLGTFAHSVAIARIIEAEFGRPLYQVGYAMAGHSMGQYSALHCVGALSFADAVRLLSARSSYMSMTDTSGGGMGCIVGLDRVAVENCLMAANGHGYAAISNHNARDQFIISGQNNALDVVLRAASNAGARLARRLNVSVPAHCELMRDAGRMLRAQLAVTPVDAPKTNWFSNQTAAFMSNPMDVRDALADQMTHGVRWLEIMEKFPTYSITQSYELGPGAVLSKLIKRADVGTRAASTDNIAGVRKMLDALATGMNHVR
ncbi:MAG TPA: hypothetical protein DD611_02635 [Alphaproteobacteria bacterium]|mgnify:FL=1|nr:hypothetical protein [Alphaproteobacteria bacterium]HBS76529.1 hypothetical protein [Alphaproteobacteria bacterium]